MAAEVARNAARKSFIVVVVVSIAFAADDISEE